MFNTLWETCHLHTLVTSMHLSPPYTCHLHTFVTSIHLSPPYSQLNKYWNVWLNASFFANEGKVSNCAVLEKRVGENGDCWQDWNSSLLKRSFSTDVVIGSEGNFILFILLLLWHYNSDRVLAFLTISFHLRQSCTCCAQFISFIFFRSFLTSSFHRDLGLPAGLPVNGFHLCILFIVLVWGILFMCRN
jgi:hypothetical protein